MLYGCLPFRGSDERALLESIEKGKLPARAQGVSQRTQDLLKDMLTPKPEDRIELLDILDIVSTFELEAQAKKLEEYRARSLTKL
jgi:serine/threonine protein kinase